MHFATIIIVTNLLINHAENRMKYLYDIMKQNHLLASVILRNALSELRSRYFDNKKETSKPQQYVW